jgi:hypothetical protein
MPGLTIAAGTLLAEAAEVCLEDQSHTPGVQLMVDGDVSDQMTLNWSPVSTQQRKAYADMQEATEWGASGIGIVALHRKTGKVVTERSIKGTRFDYWFGEDDGELFQNKLRLECSGILKGTQDQIKVRVTQKIAQVKSAKNHQSVPAYVSVVEFGDPRARVAKVK